MARPPKVGLDYYPIDVDIIHNIKVKKLILHHGGARAFGVFICLLSEIYKKGYYLEICDDVVFIIASYLYEDECYVNDIIQFCVKYKLFDCIIYDKYNVLTSYSIQIQYSHIQSSCKRKAVVTKYSLLDNPQSIELVSSESNVNSEETNDTTEENEVTSQSITQIKINNKKDNNKKDNNITQPLTSTSLKFENEIEKLVSDNEWTETITTFNNITLVELKNYLNQFKTHCVILGKLYHTSTDDVKSHFANWLSKQLHQTNNYTSNGKETESRQCTNSQSGDLRRPASVPVGARQKDFCGGF